MSAPPRSWLPPGFPERFFGPGNKLRWEKIQEKRLPHDTLERLAPWIEALRAGEDPLCLPRVREDDRVEWYALSATASGARALREQLIAFVGPSYAGPWAAWSQLDTQDPIDQAVRQAAPGRAFRLRVPRKEYREHVRRKLLLMQTLRKERPLRLLAVPRPTGRILGDFEHALRAGDGTAAAGHIAEFRRLGRLSAQNQLFLEVLRAECLQAWEELLEPRRFNTLLTLARPRRVTQALIRALYVQELRPFERACDAAGAVAHFSQLWPTCPTLFRTRRGMAAPEVTRCFMMLAAAARPARPELRDELLAALPVNALDRPYLEALAALVPGPQGMAPAHGLDAARKAFEEADVDRAFQEALTHPEGVERLALLLRCASELDTLDAARKALASVDSASPNEREALLGREPLRRHYERLLELATQPPARPTAAPPSPPVIPVDPSGWLERLRHPEPWPSALEVAEHGMREWLRPEWIGNPARVEATARELGTVRPPWGEEALRTGLPHLLSFLLTPEGPERVLKPVLEQLAVVIALDDQVRVEQLQALCEVTEALIRIGLTAGEYRSALTSLRETWMRVAAASLGDWALDTLDMLVNHPAADPEERAQFFHEVTRYLQHHMRRTSREQILLLRDLAKELALHVPSPLEQRLQDESRENSASGGTLAAALEGRKIALYSLKANVLERVTRVIKQLAPTARVACFSDKAGGSPALKQQAATADIFVIATAAAKHAATEFIGVNRPKGAATLYAAGQGSASMLRALRDATY
ncbi:protein DpdD [Stigmatella aurantiaca]|uniref:Conserved uncharacterized protein n=1 Tax=Stigmatella aurantiaca (strain DW4/3-1) TaxID=378806 RepID=E3FL13_STIAD|nr:protein DpdD [Stigmatella aurantiaca]ADO70531.1 conserved uncharacterized protein [Stigmatella aurantiaca DW4/3-1]